WISHLWKTGYWMDITLRSVRAVGDPPDSVQESPAVVPVRVDAHVAERLQLLDRCPNGVLPRALLARNPLDGDAEIGRQMQQEGEHAELLEAQPLVADHGVRNDREVTLHAVPKDRVAAPPAATIPGLSGRAHWSGVVDQFGDLMGAEIDPSPDADTRVVEHLRGTGSPPGHRHPKARFAALANAGKLLVRPQLAVAFDHVFGCIHIGCVVVGAGLRRATTYGLG